MRLTCKKCAGKPAEEKKKCPNCKGKGYIILSQSTNTQKL